MPENKERSWLRDDHYSLAHFLWAPKILGNSEPVARIYADGVDISIQKIEFMTLNAKKTSNGYGEVLPIVHQVIFYAHKSLGNSGPIARILFDGLRNK